MLIAKENGGTYTIGEGDLGAQPNPLRRPSKQRARCAFEPITSLLSKQSSTGFSLSPTVIGRPDGDMAGFSISIPEAYAMLAWKAPIETAFSST